MSPRFIALAVALLACLAMPAVAQTQSSPQTPLQKSEPPEPVQPPADLPKAPQRGDAVRGLDFLFEALKVAPDADSAKHIETRIWAMWLASGSDTANLLMTRVKAATERRDFDLAIKLLDSVIELRPDYVEAWNRRATIFYLQKDYARSLEDIRYVLALEPRHFGAISGLGMILQEYGDEKLALDAFRRALAVHPHLQRLPDMIKTLSEKVEGRDI
jgi:tetratricopeptide (TPR) repeat protein